MTQPPRLIAGSLQLDEPQLQQAIGQARQQLLAAGAQAGMRLLLIDHNSLSQLLYLLAGWQLQLLVVNLLPRLPAAELARRYHHCQPQLLFDPGGRLTTGHEPRLPTVELAPQQPLAALWPIWPNPQALADLSFTSGSSGQPRAIAHSIANHQASAAASVPLLRLTGHSRYLLSLSLAHIGGLAIIARWLVSGCTLVLADAALPLAAQVVRDQISHLSLVAAQLSRLLAELPGPGPLQQLLLGGGPVAAPLLQAGRQRGWHCLMSYGLTEMTALVCAGEQGCGQPLAGRELRLSSSGDIELRGATLAAGIWQQGQLQPLAGSDGWYRSGDLGWLDANGNLHVSGRRDSRFISGGEHIQPEQVETVLSGLAGVSRALVVPFDHPRWGQRPAALICGQLPPAAELANLLQAQLARHEWPDLWLQWPLAEGTLKADRRHWQQWANQQAQHLAATAPSPTLTLIQPCNEAPARASNPDEP